MKILINNKLEPYQNNLKNNSGKISFETGETINLAEKGKYIVPGFIDQHIHGAGGFEVMKGTKEDFVGLSNILIQEGVTSFYPTTMTATLETLEEVLTKYSEILPEINGAQMLGIHLEGPFISKEKIGAQNPEFLQKLTVENLKKIGNLEHIKIITYAPELDENFEFTKFLKKNKIVGSVGHSMATCEQTLEAHKHGLCCYTHLHNAMSGYNHNHPGVLNAAYLNQEAHKELIVDGIHIHPDVVKSTYQNIGYDKINLITDAMHAKHMPNGKYDFSGLEVFKDDTSVRLANKTLAGSILSMNDAIKNMYKFSNCQLEELFQMASYNQAKLFNLTNKGIINENKDFDITVLDEDLNVIQVFIAGKEKYNANN